MKFVSKEMTCGRCLRWSEGTSDCSNPDGSGICKVKSERKGIDDARLNSHIVTHKNSVCDEE